MTRRRRHSDDFKQNAVRMMLSQGRTASDVARELRIHPSQLFRWRQEMRDTAAPMPKQESVEQEPARRPKRRAVYATAKAKHPERWSRNTRNWDPILIVTLNPERESARPEPLKNAA